MATFLFTWELGAGLGHVTVIKPLAEGLARRGHTVWAALRDLSSAEMLFAGTGVTCLQAPIKTSPPANPVRQPSTFAHVLHNCGFGDVAELRGLVGAWRGLYQLARPDVIVADHSPAALLAARTWPARRVPMGISFGIPIGGRPFPDWRPSLKTDPEKLARDEASVCRIANEVLAGIGQPRIERLADIFSEVDDTLLGSIPELDIYGPRPIEQYCGVWGTGLGEQPDWPKIGRKRVFAYLKPSKHLVPLLEVLARGNIATLAYLRGDLKPLEKYESNRLRFVRHPLELAAVGRECDAAIAHATHGVTSALLLAGKPLLLFPIVLEQRLTAQCVVRAGAGLAARPEPAAPIAARLDALLLTPRYRQAAEDLAQRRAGMLGPQCVERAIARLERLAPTPPA